MEITFSRVVEFLLVLIPVASVLVNLTPNDSDNRILAFVDKILNALALNFNVKGNLNK